MQVQFYDNSLQVIWKISEIMHAFLHKLYVYGRLVLTGV